MKTLREAIDRGYKDIENIRRDNDLDALRARVDFQELVRGLADQPSIGSDDSSGSNPVAPTSGAEAAPQDDGASPKAPVMPD
jgi:hypothetical protein